MKKGSGMMEEPRACPRMGSGGIPQREMNISLCAPANGIPQREALPHCVW